MSHLNLMDAVTVDITEHKYGSLHNWVFRAVLADGKILDFADLSISWMGGYAACLVGGGSGVGESLDAEISLESVHTMLEVLNASICAAVKLDGLSIADWAGQGVNYNEWKRDCADALYVLRDNIAMYLNPPTEPISAHNEGNPLSCAGAGAYEAEKELMGEYFAPVGSVVLEDEAITDEEWAVAGHEFSSGISPLDILQENLMLHPDLAYELYLFHVEKHAEFTHDEYMRILSDVFFEKGV